MATIVITTAEGYEIERHAADDPEPECARCEVQREQWTCDDCGLSALLIDCGHYDQPRPIAHDGGGHHVYCDDCSDWRGLVADIDSAIAGCEDGDEEGRFDAIVKGLSTPRAAWLAVNRPDAALPTEWPHSGTVGYEDGAEVIASTATRTAWLLSSPRGFEPRDYRIEVEVEGEREAVEARP